MIAGFSADHGDFHGEESSRRNECIRESVSFANDRLARRRGVRSPPIGGTNNAARRRFQPMRRASLRGRPHGGRMTWNGRPVNHYFSAQAVPASGHSLVHRIPLPLSRRQRRNRACPALSGRFASENARIDIRSGERERARRAKPVRKNRHRNLRKRALACATAVRERPRLKLRRGAAA